MHVFCFLGLLYLSDSRIILQADINGSNTIPRGACGFGPLNVSEWPGRAVASLSPMNAISRELSMSGCGACLLLTCQGKVSQALSLSVRALANNVYQHSGHLHQDINRSSTSFKVGMV